MGAWSREQVSHVIDVLLGYFVLMPLVVLFWHSTWNMFEPETMTPTFAWTELAVGMVIEVLLGFFQVPFRNYLQVQRSRSSLTYVVATRLYNYALGTVNILHYKALADLYGLYTEEDSLMTAIQTAATATVLLASLRVTRNILGVPFFVDVDCNIEDYFQTSPYFSTGSDMSMFDLFDHAMTIVMVHTLVHVHWIGVGVILESLLFPNDQMMAVMVNMALGYATCSALLASQERLVATSQNLEAAGSRKLRVLFEDVVIVAANTASIFLWNGMWSIFDITFVPDDTSYILVQLATYVLLVLAHATPNVIGKGCDIDGQATGGDGVTWCTGFVAAILAGHGASADESDKDK